MEFHETQLKAIDFIVNAIKERKKIVGLTGAGGTGKSEIVSNIVNSGIEEVEIYVSAATHKAASRLRKDLPDAKTLHSSVAKPNYTQLYLNLEAYYKQEEKSKDFKLLEVTKSFMIKYNLKLESYKSSMDLISSLGKTVFDKDFFKGYFVQDYVPNSCLIIDEASMVPTKSIWKDGSLMTIGIDTAAKVYDTIVLVGDMNQLPPINGKSSFEGIETIELTKNFRSNKSLLKCIDYVRQGKDLEYYELEEKESVKIVSSITSNWYTSTYMRTDVVHICYTNKTRRSITHSIRNGEGEKPNNGEPILYRGFSNGNINKGDIGVYKNGIVDFGDDINWKLKSYNVSDEYNKKGWSIFSFGYALTAHSAQGSGFDHVIVHAYDIPGFIDNETKNQWLYTACSRSKKSLTIII